MLPQSPSRRRLTVGLVSGGLGVYWDQFPGLRESIEDHIATIARRLQDFDLDLVDAGLISDATQAGAAADRLRSADLDLLIVNVPTYLTSSMILPIVQRVAAPVLVIDLQPSSRMTHESFDTGQWLAYCGQCSIPELGNVFRRAGISFRSVTGYLDQDLAWHRIGRWLAAARVRARLQRARIGLMGHLYPGMLDVATDLTSVCTQLGSHIEVLEFDDLRVRVDEVSSQAMAARHRAARETFTVDQTAQDEDLTWAARVSVGLDQLVADFDLDAVAYYHRGLGGEMHERLGAGMILGASLLTAAGVPFAGEYELRTAIAMMISQELAGGGSFTEIQALNFDDGVVEMGHDGPAHLALSARRPVLRGLGTYHGKRGWGVSVEFDVEPGPVTLIGVGQDQDGSYVIVTAEGTVIPGPVLSIGNTSSRVDFDQDPGEWVDDWSSSGVGHHWSLTRGHLGQTCSAVADLLTLRHRAVTTVSPADSKGLR